ncbi:MAG: hypothetical protein ACYDCK_02740 [Thermoplasmatota archaeon]
MRDEAILATLAELDRWRERRAALPVEAAPGESEKLDRQVAYYEALVREMKRATRPEGLAHLLRSF